MPKKPKSLEEAINSFELPSFSNKSLNKNIKKLDSKNYNLDLPFSKTYLQNDIWSVLSCKINNKYISMIKMANEINLKPGIDLSCVIIKKPNSVLARASNYKVIGTDLEYKHIDDYELFFDSKFRLKLNNSFLHHLSLNNTDNVLVFYKKLIKKNSPFIIQFFNPMEFINNDVEDLLQW